MSLFERLVEPLYVTDTRLPLSVLETQRRMYPSIAELIRSTLYPSLKDADKVAKYPGVIGIKKRLFWFYHEQPEAGTTDHDPLSTSHSNEFEVEMTITLVSYLVRQGEYSRSDITVITPYLGQLQRLRRRMETMFKIYLNDRDQEQVEALEADGPEVLEPTPRAQLAKTTLAKSIRIATVDNFQGEEAKVIVICLVRSNPQNNCGFLRTSNRINVLLSRAQHRMYIIGNANTYRGIRM
ncbi:AAA domain-containing protein [Lasiosphaeris hirsuta]|uniref:AAA domain-containing protein n=1 Tax=Lasiosphaeris hirsuta TaxID=260670 RepID=A0AA40AGC5_9PEZI|nr:AAA domain-containing protein [Lasiosphaeris hirsuta]